MIGIEVGRLPSFGPKSDMIVALVSKIKLKPKAPVPVDEKNILTTIGMDSGDLERVLWVSNRGRLCFWEITMLANSLGPVICGKLPLCFPVKPFSGHLDVAQKVDDWHRQVGLHSLTPSKFWSV